MQSWVLFFVFSPHAIVDIVAVQVTSQAILCGIEGLVATMDVYRTRLGVIHTAVAVAPMDQRPARLQNTPPVLRCVQKETVDK